MKGLTILFVLLSSMACVPLYYGPTAPLKEGDDDGDIMFIQTGAPDYYYIVDTKRNLCFFHNRLYGRRHLLQMECKDIPEYSKLMKETEVLDSVPTKPDATPKASEEKPAPSTLETTPSKAGAGNDTAPTEAEAKAFRRAYVQHFCARQKGDSMELEAILTTHGIDQERYNNAKMHFSRDKSLWQQLTKEAMDTCTDAAPK